MSDDGTTLYHNHPFHYISIILNGGYKEVIYTPLTNKRESRKHKRFSIILRNKSVYHRIEKVDKGTLTLFIAYGKGRWNAINFGEPKMKDGIYIRTINEKEKWCKYKQGIWYVGSKCFGKAALETRPSIHQV